MPAHVVIQDFRPDAVIEMFWRETLDIEEDAEWLGVELVEGGQAW